MNEVLPKSLELARACQWELMLLTDPVELALKGHEAAYQAKSLTDKVTEAGIPIRVHSLGGFVLEQWDEQAQGYVTIQFDRILASGESSGISFIQYSPDPEISTLFLGLKNATVLEIEQNQKRESDISLYASRNLVIPVLDIDAVELIAA